MSDAARAVVDAYITASGALDVASLGECFAPGAALHGYLGESLITGDAGLYLADVEKLAAAGADMSGYEGYVTALTVSGRIASATVSMRGFAGTEFIDYLHLASNRDNAWRIVAKTFTTVSPRKE